MKSKLLTIIYVGASLPLLFGSLVFYYWYLAREWFARDIDIGFIAVLTVLSYLLLGLSTLILCWVYNTKQRGNWKRSLPAVFLVVLTIPIIDIFDTIHNSLEQKAYIELINDLEATQILSIRSDNFEYRYFQEHKKEHIFSYNPVYRYDWTFAISGSWYDYEINMLSIAIKMQNDSIKTFDMPQLRKGSCTTITLSEIVSGKQAKP